VVVDAEACSNRENLSERCDRGVSGDAGASSITTPRRTGMPFVRANGTGTWSKLPRRPGTHLTFSWANVPSSKLTRLPACDPVVYGLWFMVYGLWFMV
jgi:hypothetical protein